MPIRIYALAKELDIDNKKLVDICNRAGITGKGSALASLSDEEVVRLKTFMGGGKATKPDAAGTAAHLAETTAAGATRSIRREDYIAPTGNVSTKVPVLPSKSEKPPLSRKKPEAAPTVPPAKPAASETEAEASSGAGTSPIEAAPVQPAVVKSTKPVTATPVEKPVTPPAPTIAAVAPSTPPPVTRSTKIETGPPMPPPLVRPQSSMPGMSRPLDRMLGKKPPEKKPSTEKRPPEKTGPAIQLAPMPAAPKSPFKSKSKEPAPQKPDIRLPPDAIRAGKAGTKPLSEHIRKHEEKKKRDDLAAKKGPTGKPRTKAEEALPLAELPLKDRPRRSVGGPRVAVAGEEREGAPSLGALGGREQRQLKRKRAATVKRIGGEEEEVPVVGASVSTGSSSRRMHIRRTGTNTAAPRKGKVAVTLPCTVRTFSESIGIPARTIQSKLLSLGIMSNINANLEPETAELLAVELGVDVDFHREQALEERVLESLDQEDAPESLQPRPPVVTVLGHVDHGKTSLLDRIIGLDVAAHEKGGITQHIRAYKIEKDGKPITFVDTPGHEAFTEMRARGANVTDIAVLVVAADDGVMPQTEEAISHAKAAGVPIIVALNKIDLPGINIDRIYQQLATNDLLPSDWGGETELVKTSATTGVGLDDLLSTILTVAELREYKANPDRKAQGTCLEAEMHEERGVIAKLLVQNGTLRPGDVVVCGSAYGRVKAMQDTLIRRKRLDEAGPSTPVNVTGLNVAPGAGDRFHVLSDISEARQLADQRAANARQRELSGGRAHVTLETLFERLGEQDEVQTLNMILRADVRGSIEAIKSEIGKLAHPEVQIRILQATVGGITEADVHLADASDAIIIGFNVVPDEGARQLADARGVQVRRYDIIYQVTDDLKAALEGMLRPEKHEKDLGRALVQRTYVISRIGTVAGCRVLAGVIQRDSRIRVIRENRVIGDYALATLKREKDDAREVREGLECGIHLNGFNDVKEGDVLEAYKIEEVKRTLAESMAT